MMDSPPGKARPPLRWSQPSKLCEMTPAESVIGKLLIMSLPHLSMAFGVVLWTEPRHFKRTRIVFMVSVDFCAPAPLARLPAKTPGLDGVLNSLSRNVLLGMLSFLEIPERGGSAMLGSPPALRISFEPLDFDKSLVGRNRLVIRQVLYSDVALNAVLETNGALRPDAVHIEPSEPRGLVSATIDAYRDVAVPIDRARLAAGGMARPRHAAGKSPGISIVVEEMAKMFSRQHSGGLLTIVKPAESDRGRRRVPPAGERGTDTGLPPQGSAAEGPRCQVKSEMPPTRAAA